LIYQNRSSTAEIHFAVGPSFGRIREASPLLAALRIRAILQEEGLIEHELSAEEVEGLAQCVARSDYWSSAIRFDRSTRYWFDDIESFLRPRLHPGLEVPARVWFRIRDAIRLALPDVGYERITGVQLVPWVGFTARSEHRRQVWPTEGRADTTAFTTFERQVGGIELEGGYSATTRVYFHLKADWQPDISQSPLEWDENLQVSARYLVFDRLYVSAGWSHIATRRPRVFHDVHESPSVWAEWYVEDRLLLRGGPAYSWNDRWDTEASYLSRSASFYVSFDCRLF
jgi:hypothetical protein